jgi:PAS domain S-box-containing protein
MLVIMAFAFWQPARRNRLVKKQSALLTAIYDSLPDTIVCKDMNSTYTNCNHAFLEMTGRSESDIIGKTSLEVFPEQPELAQVLEDADKIILNGNTVSRADSWFLMPDQTRRLYTTVRTPVIENGKRVGVVGVSRDITEQKRMTEEIERRDFLVNTINQAANILLESDNDSFDANMLRCMEMVGTVVGVDRVSIWKNYLKDDKLHCSQILECVCSKSRINEYLPADISYDLLPGWEKTLLQGECVSSRISDIFPKEQAPLSPDEELSLFAVPVFALKNKFWGFVCFDNCREERIYTETEKSILHSGSLVITNALLRHEMDQNIHETATLLQTVVENYLGIIWCVNRDGKISLYNGMMIAKLGLFPPGVTPDHIIGKSFDDLPPKLMHPQIVDSIQKTFTDGAQEFVLKTELGAFHVRTSPI